MLTARVTSGPRISTVAFTPSTVTPAAFDVKLRSVTKLVSAV